MTDQHTPELLSAEEEAIAVLRRVATGIPARRARMLAEKALATLDAARVPVSPPDPEGLRKAAQRHVDAECRCSVGTHNADCELVVTEDILRAAIQASPASAPTAALDVDALRLAERIDAAVVKGEVGIDAASVSSILRHYAALASNPDTEGERA